MTYHMLVITSHNRALSKVIIYSPYHTFIQVVIISHYHAWGDAWCNG